MIKQGLLLTILAFSSLSAYAADEATCPLTAGPAQEVLFVSPYSTEGCSIAQRLAKTIAAVSQNFKQGPSMILIMGDKAGNASFDSGGILRIPQRLVFADDKGQEHTVSLDQLQTVVIHEFGHAILRDVWEREFPTELGDLFAELRDISSLAVYNTKHKYSGRGLRQKSADMANHPLYTLYFLELSAYGELYADALAALFLNNPSAMKDALDFPGIPTSQSIYTNPRDFARDNTIAELDAHPDVHTKLSAVRTYLGKLMKDASLEERKDIFNRLEKAITRAVREDLAAEKVPDTATANKRLIKYMQD